MRSRRSWGVELHAPPDRGSRCSPRPVSVRVSQRSQFARIVDGPHTKRESNQNLLGRVAPKALCRRRFGSPMLGLAGRSRIIATTPSRSSDLRAVCSWAQTSSASAGSSPARHPVGAADHRQRNSVGHLPARAGAVGSALRSWRARSAWRWSSGVLPIAGSRSSARRFDRLPASDPG